MVGIKYIGKRETHTDNLYGTNLVWTPGQVHNVSEEVAKKMKPHADVYAEEIPVKGESPAAVKPAKAEETKVPLPNLDHMTREDMIQFAQQHFGEKMHHKMSEENMRLRITGLINLRGR